MAEITIMKTAAESRLGEQFRAAPHAATAARAEAFAAFQAAGLPHRRIEAWHYTDLRTLLRDAYPPAAAPSEAVVARARTALGPAASPRVVLVDGVYVPSLSVLEELPQGVSVTPLLDGAGSIPVTGAALAAAQALGASESVLALNTAFLQGGVLVRVAAETAVEVPLQVVSVVSGEAPSAVTTRSLVELGAGASLTLAERHLSLGAADCQGNHALVFAIGDGATLDHACAVEGGSVGSLHLGSLLVRLGANASVTSFTLAAAIGVVRRQAFLEFAGEGSKSQLNGVTLLEKTAHADTTLVVTHTAAHCESREYYKTILDDESTGVYQGKVVVSPGAQKTDGKMLSKAIFLADGASMFNKPELEIFADDVVCGHGATVGYLDENQLFYLRARGIPLKQAQSLLLNAFAADAVEVVTNEGHRNALTGSIEQWLAKRHL